MLQHFPAPGKSIPISKSTISSINEHSMQKYEKYFVQGTYYPS